MIAIAADKLGTFDFALPWLVGPMVIVGIVALAMWLMMGGVREVRRTSSWKAAGLIVLGLVALLAIQTAVNRFIPQ